MDLNDTVQIVMNHAYFLGKADDNAISSVKEK